MGILSTIVLVPIVAVILISLVPESRSAWIKRIAFIAAGINLCLATWLLIDFTIKVLHADSGGASTALALEYVERYHWFEKLGIDYFMGADGISVLMIFLTAIVIFCGVCASWDHSYRVKEFFNFLFLLVTGVFGVFAARDLFLFFLFYELAVLPMYLLIGIWGTGPREYSAMKLTLMLMGGSALIFLGILVLYFESGAHSFSMVEIGRAGVSESTQRWLFPVMFFGFGTLGGLWPFHTWSPDGHASAPTAVSMLHAGVLMKLGGYGCLLSMYLMPKGAIMWSGLFLVLTTINLFYGSLIAVKKTDLKYITAYSSVSHCGLILFGLGTLNSVAFKGAVFQMYAHGLMTALFFALIGMIYGRTHTRYVTEMGGLLSVMPWLGCAYFVGGLAGLGLPGLAGFIAEIQVFMGAFSVDSPIVKILTVLAASSVVTTAVYMLRALTKMFYGPIQNSEHAKLTDANLVEKLALVILVFLLGFSGMFPGWLMKIISYSLNPIMAQIQQIKLISGI
jgi:NADH-quinone oxidoreductase subunit M